ncbi:hypothetical protein HTZ77_36625 [Nonomuraea sp. SMC257]|uniref:Uncharacterized protein n=1 Tax=Nonomuraea montanisoli TaxID=2741721 RepID=A0A7Y6IEV0_9ACTN|nr:hypothetical protein [Nonomuraea montanisoli]NUW36892.1 hypothetical protein [Nonomuraea montanisoli]
MGDTASWATRQATFIIRGHDLAERARGEVKRASEIAAFGTGWVATVRHLEISSVDGAPWGPDLLIATNVPAKAERAGKTEQLRTLPKARKAVARAGAHIVLVPLTV